MKERLTIWIAWRLPARLVYWAAVRVGSHATGPDYPTQIVPHLLFMEGLARWDETFLGDPGFRLPLLERALERKEVSV